MALTKEQIEEVKSQLREQVNHLPESQKAQAIQQIESLTEEAIESLISQQKQKNKDEKGIFRKIIDKEIPSKILVETKTALAVLDIRPISKGHVIIIPKTAVTDAKKLPNSVFTLAKKIAKIISSKLKSKGTEIQTQFSFGEIIINVIPIYDKSLNINSPRIETKEEDLQELQFMLKIRPKEKKEVIKIEPVKTEQSQIEKIKRRIP